MIEPRARRRTPLAVAASVAVVALALIAGNAIAERRGTAGAPGTPTPIAATSAPAGAATPNVLVASPRATPATSPTTPAATGTTGAPPAASPTTARAGEYGYVFTVQPQQPCTSGCRIVVRRERDASTAFELDGVLPAVSPDGSRLAYWRTTPGVGPTDLRVLQVSDPRSDSSVLAVSGQTVGGSVVWSSDGGGLLVITESRERAGGVGGGHCAVNSTLVAIELTASPPPTRTAPGRPSACVHIPLAWDRANRIAAVIGMGPGGYATEYLTWDGSSDTVSSAEVPRLVLAGFVRASTDGLVIAAVEDSLTVVRVWPTRDITKAERFTRPARIGQPFWRPAFAAHYEIVWGTGQRLETFRYPGGATAPLFTTAAGPVAIRPDGSGLIITEGGDPSAGVPRTRLVVFDIATRQTREMMVITGSIGGTEGLHPRGVILR